MQCGIDDEVRIVVWRRRWWISWGDGKGNRIVAFLRLFGRWRFTLVIDTQNDDDDRSLSFFLDV